MGVPDVRGMENKHSLESPNVQKSTREMIQIEVGHKFYWILINFLVFNVQIKTVEPVGKSKKLGSIP